MLIQRRLRNDDSFDGASTPRSRGVIFGVLTLGLAIYIGGIFWFGRGLADDMRAGVREIQSGVLVPDMER